MAERATGIQKTNSTSRFDSSFYSVTVSQFPNLSDSVFISINRQSQNFNIRRLFRSHQNPAPLACYYLGNEAQRNIVLTHCFRGGTYLGLCEGQNDINICENTL